MTAEIAAQTIDSAKKVLEEYGFETCLGTQTFPLLATNQVVVILVYIAQGSLDKAAEAVNHALSQTYFEKRLGAQSRDMYVIMLCPKKTSDTEALLAENDARICRKVVVPVGTQPSIDLREKLHFLKPLKIVSHVPDATTAIERLYLEALREKLEPSVMATIERAFAEEWSANKILSALRETAK